MSGTAVHVRLAVPPAPPAPPPRPRAYPHVWVSGFGHDPHGAAVLLGDSRTEALAYRDRFAPWAVYPPVHDGRFCHCRGAVRLPGEGGPR